MSDNAGGGAPGDSTFVLRELLARGVTNVGLAPIWDPIAVRLAVLRRRRLAADAALGGKMGPASGDPLDLTVRVKGLVRDLVQRWPQAVGHADVPCGDGALLDCDGIDVVVISVRHQAFGTELFTAFGVDPGDYRLIVVKSINHFNAAYGPLASRSSTQVHRARSRSIRARSLHPGDDAQPVPMGRRPVDLTSPCRTALCENLRFLPYRVMSGFKVLLYISTC